MAISKIVKAMNTESLTFTVNENVITNPTSIKASRFGNVVHVTFWGTKLASNLPATSQNVITGLPACAHQGTAHLGLAGANTYNIQGNVYNSGADSGNLNVGLKSGYSADTAMYASLIYLAK